MTPTPFSVQSIQPFGSSDSASAKTAIRASFTIDATDLDATMKGGLQNTMQAAQAAMSQRLAVQKDDLIRRAINNHLGHTDWKPEEIKNRCRFEKHEGSDLEHFVMDDQPLCVFGPVEILREPGLDPFEHTLRLVQGYKILNEP